MKKYPHVEESVIDDIRAEIGPFMDELYAIAREMDRREALQRFQQKAGNKNE